MALIHLNDKSYYVEDKVLQAAVADLKLTRLISVQQFANLKGTTYQNIWQLYQQGAKYQKINPEDVHEFAALNLSFIDYDKYIDLPIGKDKITASKKVAAYKPRSAKKK